MSRAGLLVAVIGVGLGGTSLFLQLLPKPTLIVRTPIIKTGGTLSYSAKSFTPNGRFISGFLGRGNFQGTLSGDGSLDISFAVADPGNQSYLLYLQDETGKFAVAQIWVQA